MSVWYIVKPRETTNYISDPRVTSLTGWTASISTMELSYEQARWGLTSVKATGSGSIVYQSPSVSMPTGNYAFSLYVFSTSDISVTVHGIVDGYEQAVQTFAIPVNRWYRVILPDISIDAGTHTLGFAVDVPSAGSIYVDGLQVEIAPATTYCDGFIEDCRWTGPVNASPSKRIYRKGLRGGELVSFESLGIKVSSWGGIGVPKVDLGSVASPTGVGLANWWTNISEREIILNCRIQADSSQSIHSVRELLSELLGDNVTFGTPVRLMYKGTGMDLYMDAVYVGGFELQPSVGLIENFALKFVVPESLLQEDTTFQHVMSLPKLMVAPYVLGRVDGEWTEISYSTDAEVLGIERGPDGYVYAFGMFTNINAVPASRIARWDGNQWEQVGPGLNGTVWGLLWAPDGTMYVWGEFTATADGAMTLNYVASWDGTSFSAMNGGMDYYVYGGAWDYTTSSLVVVGYFSNINYGTADQIAAYAIARWNTSTFKWETVAPTGTYPGEWDNLPITIDIDSAGRIYIGGYFTTVPAAGGGSKTAYRIAMNDGTDWYDLGDGFDDDVYVVKIGPDGYLYAGGKFRQDGLAANYYRGIARWNGLRWEELPDKGVDGQVWTIDFDDRGNVWIGGNIRRAGGIQTIDGFAVWNRATFRHVDLLFMSYMLSSVYTKVNHIDIDQWGNVWTAFDNSQGARAPTVDTITNNASTPMFPQLIVIGPCRLMGLENQTTGQNIYMDITVDTGEIVTLDTYTGSLVSDMRGNISGAILPGSDVSRFQLIPGENRVAVWLSDYDETATKIILRWDAKHLTADGAL